MANSAYHVISKEVKDHILRNILTHMLYKVVELAKYKVVELKYICGNILQLFQIH